MALLAAPTALHEWRTSSYCFLVSPTPSSFDAFPPPFYPDIMLSFYFDVISLSIFPPLIISWNVLLVSLLSVCLLAFSYFYFPGYFTLAFYYPPDSLVSSTCSPHACQHLLYKMIDLPSLLFLSGSTYGVLLSKNSQIIEIHFTYRNK